MAGLTPCLSGETPPNPAGKQNLARGLTPFPGQSIYRRYNFFCAMQPAPEAQGIEAVSFFAAGKKDISV
jgi:hypothetical protein